MEKLTAQIAAAYLGCPVFTYSGNGTLNSIDMDGHWYVSLYNNRGGTAGNLNDRNIAATGIFHHLSKPA